MKKKLFLKVDNFGLDCEIVDFLVLKETLNPFLTILL
jgi:hypothetical protein